MASTSAQGKTVLITGTSSGIGKATALLLAQNGWSVFAGVRKQSDYESLQKSHANIHPVFLDLLKPDQISNAIESVRVAVGAAGLDALVNNAGTAHMGPMELLTPEDFEDDVRLNLFGVFRLTQVALPLLRLGTPGRIINVSSVVGITTLPFCSGYCASKHALESLSVSMRLEFAPMGISVSVLGAGPVRTNFLKTPRDTYDRMKEKNKTNAVLNEFYAERMQKLWRMNDKMHATASTSDEDVAKQIKRMLTASWFRHRYCDSYFSWVGTILYTWLPSWIVEWMSAATIDMA